MTTAWIPTRSGLQFDLINPNIFDINISDIAYGLANTARYRGQTDKVYSVAMHCLLLAELVPRPYRLHALLHDAAEAYLGDLSFLLKPLFPRFSALEDNLLKLIYRKYQADFKDDKLIDKLDRLICADEKKVLFPAHANVEWDYNLDTTTTGCINSMLALYHGFTSEDIARMYIYQVCKYQSEWVPKIEEPVPNAFDETAYDYIELDSLDTTKGHYIAYRLNSAACRIGYSDKDESLGRWYESCIHWNLDKSKWEDYNFPMMIHTGKSKSMTMRVVEDFTKLPIFVIKENHPYKETLLWN